MKILVLADVESPAIWDYFDPDKFKEVELMISCGDLKAEYLSFLVTMIKAPLYYVPGNHNGGYAKKPPDGCISIDKAFVNYKGLRIVGFGGCQRYNKGEHQYTEKQMKKRINALWFKLFMNRGFDILVTHAPAFELGDGDDLCHRGFKAFRHLLDKYHPKLHLHGHQHLNYGMQERIIDYNGTTIVNAYGYRIIDFP